MADERSIDDVGAVRARVEWRDA